MDKHAILNLNIRTYCNLKEQRDRINDRLDELNKSIKAGILETVHDAGDYIDGDIPAVPEWIKYHGSRGFTAHVHLKRSKPKYDPYELEDLLRQKGLWVVAKKEVVDEDFVETLFINGILTDADIRSVISDPGSPQLALKVERIPNV